MEWIESMSNSMVWSSNLSGVKPCEGKDPRFKLERGV